MKKSDKKRENQLIQALKCACEDMLDSIPGFCWVTHKVDFQRFEQSLKVILVFDTLNSLASAKSLGMETQILAIVNRHLTPISIGETQLYWDSEEACEVEHKGSWKARLSNTKH